MAIKYIQLAAALRTDIREGVYRSTGRLPTEMQLTQRYGVSRQTVRQALALLAQEGLIEKRQGSGSHILESPAQARENSVAVVPSSVSDDLFPSLFQNIQHVLGTGNYAALVYSTQGQLNREREILTALLEHPVRGVLIEGIRTALPNPNMDLYQHLRQRRVPMVFLQSGYPALDAVCISADDEDGGYRAVQYLLEKGHTRLGGLFRGDELQGHRRYYGFQTALRDRNLPYPDDRIFWYGEEERRALLDLGQNDWLTRFAQMARRECTAVVCHSDEVAYPLIQILQTLGTRVPEDLAVISFDNSHYSDLGHITSFSLNAGRMGRLAAQALLDQMRERVVRSQTVDWQLVEKESS